MARRRTPLAVLLLLLPCAAALAPARAAADDKPGDKADAKAVDVVFTAKAEPEAVAPGSSGLLVLAGDIRPTVRVLADPSKFVVTPFVTAGVSYGKVDTSAPEDHRDPKFPDKPAEKAWTGRVIVRIPFTVAADAPNPVEPGANVLWTACDETSCHDPESTPKPITVSVKRPDAPAEPAPSAPPPADGTVGATAPKPGATPPPPPPAPPSEKVPPAVTKLGDLQKEHNVDVGGGKLALRLVVPADVVGYKGQSVGLDVFFYDEQGRPIRSTIPAYGDAAGNLHVSSKSAAVESDAASFEFAFTVPYAAFPSRGAKYGVEARASLSTRVETRGASTLLATKNTTFSVE